MTASRQLSRLLILVVLGGGGILPMPTGVNLAFAAGPENRPSVLLISVDNLRPDRMSVYGYDRDTTPYLREFARESFVFERAFSTSAWTAPGMVSIFTGYYPPVHAQHGRHSYYDETLPSALRVLAAKGYEILGQAIRGPSHEGFGFEKVLGKRPDRLASFIEDRAGDPTPFFAWAHLTDVHLPYDPSAESATLFETTSHDSAAIEAVRSHRIILRNPEVASPDLRHAGVVVFDETDKLAVRALYDAEVADVDLRLRHYLQRMRDNGLLDRTIIILTADHGEELFEHGWLGHASTSYDAKLYDELIRVPLIMRLPGGSSRGRSDALVQGVDIMPTLFDLLDIDASEIEPAMQGHSLLPLMTGETDRVREFVFSQTTLKGWTTPRDEMQARIVSVRSLGEKLIVNPAGRDIRFEVYDLVGDPAETDNIYRQADVRFRRLERALGEWRADNRMRSATLVMAGARERLRQIGDALLERDDLELAVRSWTAIQTMEATWGLEPDVFYEWQPFADRWREIQAKAARMIGIAMNCRADAGTLESSNPRQFDRTEDWHCR